MGCASEQGRDAAHRGVRVIIDGKNYPCELAIVTYGGVVQLSFFFSFLFHPF